MSSKAKDPLDPFEQYRSATNPDLHQGVGCAYPFVQWSMQPLPVAGRGQPVPAGVWVLPTTKYGLPSTTTILGWSSAVIRRTDLEPSLWTPKIAMTVVSVRKCYFTDTDILYSSYSPGTHSWVQAIGLIYGLQKEGRPVPVAFTYKSTITKDFLGAIKKFNDTVVAEVNSGKTVPIHPYAVWMKLGAGKQDERGKKKKSNVIPPVLIPPVKLDSATLAKMAVGPDLYEYQQKLFQATASWRAEWQNLPVGPGGLNEEEEE